MYCACVYYTRTFQMKTAVLLQLFHATNGMQVCVCPSPQFWQPSVTKQWILQNEDCVWWWFHLKIVPTPSTCHHSLNETPFCLLLWLHCSRRIITFLVPLHLSLSCATCIRWNIYVCKISEEHFDWITSVYSWTWILVEFIISHIKWSWCDWTHADLWIQRVMILFDT